MCDPSWLQKLVKPINGQLLNTNTFILYTYTMSRFTSVVLLVLSLPFVLTFNATGQYSRLKTLYGIPQNSLVKLFIESKHTGSYQFMTKNLSVVIARDQSIWRTSYSPFKVQCPTTPVVRIANKVSTTL